MTNQQRVQEWHTMWVAHINGPDSAQPHWGDMIDWVTADEIARRLDEAIIAEDA